MFLKYQFNSVILRRSCLNPVYWHCIKTSYPCICIAEAPNYELYLSTFYYVTSTVSTVGYGDILPVTTTEVSVTVPRANYGNSMVKLYYFLHNYNIIQKLCTKRALFNGPNFFLMIMGSHFWRKRPALLVLMAIISTESTTNPRHPKLCGYCWIRYDNLLFV